MHELSRYRFLANITVPSDDARWAYVMYKSVNEKVWFVELGNQQSSESKTLLHEFRGIKIVE
jgi:hypothetical protein